jgi:hypothetical protein
MLRESNASGVLLALIDSNAADEPVRLATGSVGREHLLALDTELISLATRLREASFAPIARIAVIHHHVLPIANTAGGIVGAEPFMVLHNAGDVLDVLARHQFDLVLHGHKHRAQFARVDFQPDTPEGYPIAVASAGSASLRTPNNPKGNSFNLITIHDNGRLEVESLHYGGTTAPNRGGTKGEAVKKYTENMEATKRRAFIRARQRYPILTDRRILHFEISELGDLTVHHETSGLRALRASGVYRKRPHHIRIPPYGRLAINLELDPASRTAGYRLDPVETGALDGRRMVVLPENLSTDRVARYAVKHASANSMTMTLWEAKERAEADERAGKQRSDAWDEEGVSCFINHPVEELQLKLTLPPSLADVYPYLRCERLRGFPNFRINEWGDAELSPDAAFDADSEMDAEEGHAPHHDRNDGMWHLTIRRPVVGYRYRLRWPTPGAPPDEPVLGETLQSRQLLLEMADRAAPTPADKRATHVFDLLANEFEKRLSWGGSGERRSVELFVYDTAKLALRPAACWNSEGLQPNWRDFLIPLGDGIAGAAFQRRSVVTWAKQANGTVFIKPIPDLEAGAELQAILAVPVYHPHEQDKPRPSPWGTIGVVTFGSSSPASKVAQLLNQRLSPADENTLKILRGLAQAHVYDIVTALGQPTTP